MEEILASKTKKALTNAGNKIVKNKQMQAGCQLLGPIAFRMPLFCYRTVITSLIEVTDLKDDQISPAMFTYS